MYQITCPECFNTTKFEGLQNKPQECSFCFAPFALNIQVQELNDEPGGKLIGLRLICQQNSETIYIDGELNILGREYIGKQLLSNIMVNQKQVISRKHCSINKIDGKFFLKDEGSTNGTFYGLSKIECSSAARLIENNSLIFIGREAFLAQFVYERETIPDSLQNTDNEQHKVRRYRCREGCGFESETYQEICPKCMASNSLVEINR